MSFNTQGINDKLDKHIPEIRESHLAGSHLGRYPMKHRAWYPADAMTPDYVWGPMRFGRGYYHLMTPEAYKILYARMQTMGGGSCCACSKAAREEADALDDCRRLMYNRSVSPTPDDDVARKAALAAATQTAQAHYQYDQNLQLAIGAVQTGINLQR